MVVDTNVVAELMRPKPDPGVLAWAEAEPRFQLSVVTLEEIAYGLGRRKSRKLERWFEGFLAEHCEVLPLTTRIALRSGELRAMLAGRGRPRTQADMFIAATASEHNLIFATRNVRDFEGCGIRVLNPFER